MFIKLIGQSSKQERKIEVLPSDLDLTLLEFFQRHNFPIASSCRGEKICQMCKVNESILSCAITVEEFLTKNGNIVYVSYL